MDLSDIWTNIGFLIVAVLAATGAYLRRPRPEKSRDPVVAGVGLGLLERQQQERMIGAMERIASATEKIASALTDKNTESINDKLETLAERLDDMIPQGRRRRE